MSNPYSCPICNAKETSYYQYPMICGGCWKIVGRFDTGQLLMKLIFWSSMKHNKSLSKLG